MPLLMWRLELLQLRIYKTPDLESPKYQILKRTANYEVSPSFLKEIVSASSHLLTYASAATVLIFTMRNITPGLLLFFP